MFAAKLDHDAPPWVAMVIRQREPSSILLILYLPKAISPNWDQKECRKTSPSPYSIAIAQILRDSNRQQLYQPLPGRTIAATIFAKRWTGLLVNLLSSIQKRWNDRMRIKPDGKKFCPLTSAAAWNRREYGVAAGLSRSNIASRGPDAYSSRFDGCQWS